jgi:hypothetical protein
MHDDPTRPLDGKPWRVLIHDPDAGDDDPKLLLCEVIDVTPAWPRATPAAVDDAAQWAAERTGRDAVTLVPVPGARVWALDGR